MILATALAALLGTMHWLNGTPSAESLHGKIVVVDVFTFDCINCKNVTPNLRKLNASRTGEVAILGIHAPETPYERNRSNVVANLKRQGIVWPVAIDNDFKLWRAFGVEAWPTQFVFDRHGVLRKTIVGDSQDALLDTTIERLLAEK
jgi:thiol-disulfide isomerase/thioredoxin